MHNYKELNIWKRAVKLAVEVYKVTYLFPATERYELTSQVKRAVVSIASNVAEGAGRNSNNEFVHFLGIANGSAFELTTQLVIAAELELVSSERIDAILKELDEVQKMMYAFMNSLKTKTK